jgi:hypothetical protein
LGAAPNAVLETTLSSNGDRTTNFRATNLATGADTAPSIGFSHGGIEDDAYISAPLTCSGGGADLVLASGGNGAPGTEKVRLPWDGGLRLASTPKPFPCDAAHAGTFFYNNPAVGRDTVSICAKDEWNHYALRTIF